MLHDDLGRISDGCKNLRGQVGDLIEGQVLLNTRDAGDLSKIRHDLKNPLNSIIGYAEIILEESEGGLPENHMSLLQHVVELGGEISATIDTAFRHAASEEAQADEEAAIERLFASLNESSEGIAISEEIQGSPILIVDDNPTNQDILSGGVWKNMALIACWPIMAIRRWQLSKNKKLIWCCSTF